jgi:hypothetical protein
MIDANETARQVAVTIQSGAPLDEATLSNVAGGDAASSKAALLAEIAAAEGTLEDMNKARQNVLGWTGCAL